MNTVLAREPQVKAHAVYALTRDEVMACESVARIRNTLNSGQTNLTTEVAFIEDRYEQHVLACMAEVAVSRILNLAWTGCGPGAGGAADVGGFIEARSVADPSRGLLVRRRDLQRRGRPFALVLVQATRCSFLGWEFVEDAAERGRPLGDGDKRCWLVPSSDLRHLDELRAYALEWIWSNS